MQVAQALLVFGEAEGELARFESFVAQVFQVSGNLEDFRAAEGVALVFGKVFVVVAGAVSGFFGCVCGIFTVQFATVFFEY